MIQVQDLLKRLNGVEKTKEGWHARCPAHDDRLPSLSVSEGEKGVVFHCHAGCSQDAVIAALGLHPRDLFYENGQGNRSEIIDAYQYTNEEGVAVGRVLRLFPKSFRQQHRCPQAHDGWTWGLGGDPERCRCERIRLPLYHLPHLIEAVALNKTVYVAEGERDVLAIEAAGGVATTNPGGAGKWSDEYSDELRGARVRVIADRDEPGIEHAKAVAQSLEGVAGSVEILQPKEGKDAADHFAAGFGLDDFLPLTEEPSLKLYPLVSDVEAENLPSPEWGIDPIYPHGGLIVVFGPRGKGKTFLVLGWAFCHATGLPWLTRTVRRGPVVYIMAEGRGGLGVRVRAQKQHLGVQGQVGIHFITTAVPMLNDTEVDRLIATVRSLKTPPAAIVWDTLSRTFVGGDENSSKDMATYVAGIDRVKEAVGGTAIVQHHTGHGSMDRERGSSVLGGAADTIISLREQDGSLQLQCEKQKDAPEFTSIPLKLHTIEEVSSCVLKLHDPAWRNAGSLSQVEAEALRSLHGGFLEDGASATAWLKTSEMVESSFYKARTALVRRDLVDRHGEGRGTRYVTTEAGLRLLKLHDSTATP